MFYAYLYRKDQRGIFFKGGEKPFYWKSKEIHLSSGQSLFLKLVYNNILIYFCQINNLVNNRLCVKNGEG
jgi:hypothetical protein